MWYISFLLVTLVPIYHYIFKIYNKKCIKSVNFIIKAQNIAKNGIFAARSFSPILKIRLKSIPIH